MKKVLISLLVGTGFFGFSMNVDAAPANPSFKDDNFYQCVVEN